MIHYLKGDMSSPKNAKPERNRKIFELRDGGLSYRVIGERVGISTSRVKQIIGKKVRSEQPQPDYGSVDGEIVQLYETGLSEEAISYKTGVPLDGRHGVRRILKAAKRS